MVELKVKLGSKGQVVIPKIFRDNYKIYPKQEVIIVAKEEGVLIKKQDDNFIEKLREIAKRINLKGEKLSPEYIKRLRNKQYEKRARKSKIKI